MCVVLLGFLPVLWVWSVGVLGVWLVCFAWVVACVLGVGCWCAGCLAVVVSVCCGVVALCCVLLCACGECLTPVVGCATGLGFVLGGASVLCFSVVLLDGALELLVSNGFGLWLGWSLELCFWGVVYCGVGRGCLN